MISSIPDIPDNYVKGLLTIDVIVIVAILGVGAYQPIIFVYLLGLFVFVITHVLVCAYEWWNQKDIIREYFDEHPGPLIDFVFNSSGYPQRLSNSDRFCMLTFILLYFVGLLMIFAIAIRVNPVT